MEGIRRAGHDPPTLGVKWRVTLSLTRLTAMRSIELRLRRERPTGFGSRDSEW